MRLFQRFLLFLLVVFSAQATFAQRGPSFLAEQAFNKGDYYELEKDVPQYDLYPGA